MGNYTTYICTEIANMLSRFRRLWMSKLRLQEVIVKSGCTIW